MKYNFIFKYVSNIFQIIATFFDDWLVSHLIYHIIEEMSHEFQNNVGINNDCNQNYTGHSITQSK